MKDELTGGDRIMPIAEKEKLEKIKMILAKQDSYEESRRISIKESSPYQWLCLHQC